MASPLSNQHLSKKINQLTHHLPTKEELNGKREGSSYYRKINPESFIKSFEKTHHQLDNLKNCYKLTNEQKSFITDAQCQLVSEVRQAFANGIEPPHNLKDFLDNHQE